MGLVDFGEQFIYLSFTCLLYYILYIFIIYYYYYY